MQKILIEGGDRSKIAPYKPKYDTTNFVNEGEFFDTHPGVIPNITRYERTDASGKIVESWERNNNGVMIDTTKRDHLVQELIDAEEALNKMKEKNNA